jgi:dihydropyrimidinase
VDLVVRGGTVVTERWRGQADVWVSGEQVAAVVDPGTAMPEGSDPRVIDATGRLVLPGGVDPHCHVGFTSGAFTTLDNYAQATTAAVHGGTTTIVDFAIPRPGEVPLETAIAQRDKASGGFCDSALHACVVEWDDTVPAQLDRLVAEGIVTVKMFTTYRDETMANADTLHQVIKHLGRIGGMAVLHCEANHIVEDAQDECASGPGIDPGHHHKSRPEIAETASVAELIAMAEATGAPIYFVHQSTASAVDLVADARRRGVAAFTESVVHHLVLDETVYDRNDPELFVCCPPLRTAEAVADLQRRVFTGEVSTIGSDHCCYDTAQKRTTDDVREMPNGLPGVETRLPVFFSEFVNGRGLSVERFVQLTAANPARLNGLYPRKGTLAPGSDADLVIWDPTVTRTVRTADLHMATDYTPYEGLVVTGWPITTIVRGASVVEEGVFVGAEPRGRHIPAGSPITLPA